MSKIYKIDFNPFGILMTRFFSLYIIKMYTFKNLFKISFQFLEYHIVNIPNVNIPNVKGNGSQSLVIRNGKIIQTINGKPKWITNQVSCYGKVVNRIIEISKKTLT